MTMSRFGAENLQLFKFNHNIQIQPSGAHIYTDSVCEGSPNYLQSFLVIIFTPLRSFMT